MSTVFLDADSLFGDDLDWSALQKAAAPTLHPQTAAAQTAERIRDAEIVISNKVILDAGALAQATRLKLICVAATGTNNVDLAAAQARAITVCNVRNYGSESVAQHTLAMLLNLATRMPHYLREVQQGSWSAQSQFCLLDQPVDELRGKRLGLVGFGDIGQRVAQLAMAFGMQVLIAQLPGRPAQPGRLPLDALLPMCDVLSLHCPLTDLTRNLIDARRLARLPRGAWLINVARGGIADETAIADALRSGQLGAAAFDVLSSEPPPITHPLLQLKHPRLLITPHNAWGSRPARQNLLNQVAENIQAWRRGNPTRVVT